MTEITGFRIIMPPGWSQYPVNDDGRARFLAKLSTRMKELGNPELHVRVRMLAASQWRRLEQTRTHSVYFADREVEGLAHLPVSLAVAQRIFPVGATFATGLTTLTNAAIETLDTAIGSVQRWQTETRGADDLAGSVTRTIGYGFGLPGADDRRGLVFVASIPYPDDADPLLVDGASELVDSIMETFRWQ